MGEFVVNGRILPNRLHREGAEWLWRRGFLADTTIDSFQLGITGWGIPDDPRRRPDHTGDGTGGFGLDADSTYADVAASCGGAWSASHLAAMESAGEQEATFAAGDAGLVEAAAVVFSNDLPWSPQSVGRCGGWLTDGVYVPDRTIGQSVPLGGSYPLHGWPWATPIYWPGELNKAYGGAGIATIISGTEWSIALWAAPEGLYAGYRLYLTDRSSCTRYGPFEIDSIDSANIRVSSAFPSGMVEGKSYHFAIRAENAAIELIEQSPWLGTSWPVSAVYLAAVDGATSKLVATALMAADMVLHPGSPDLTVAYRALVRVDRPAVLTTHFAASLAARMFGAGSTWSGMAVGLGTVADAIDASVGLSAITEVAGDGYARASVLDWDVTVDGNGEPTAHAELATPAFANSGASAWPSFNCAFLVGTIDGTERLCAVFPLGASHAVAAGDTVSLPTLDFAWAGDD